MHPRNYSNYQNDRYASPHFPQFQAANGSVTALVERTVQITNPHFQERDTRERYRDRAERQRSISPPHRREQNHKDRLERAINAASKARDSDRALALFQEMLASNIPRSEKTYTNLITSCSYRDIERAEFYFEAMLRDEIPPCLYTLTSMISASVRVKDIGRAFHYWRVMADLKISPTIQTYTSLVAICGKSRSLETLNDVLRYAQTMDVAGDERFYTTLCYAYLQCGQIDIALEVKGAETQYPKILSICLKRTSIIDAMQVVKKINFGISDRSLLFKLFSRCAEQGSWDDILWAIHLFELSKCSLNPKSLHYVVRRFFGSQNNDEIVALVNKAEKLGTPILPETWATLARKA